MKTNKISKYSKILLLTGGVFLIISLFTPIWSIYLDAPQYPEGLSLKIWANKLAGDVDIINGLNHYIGMKTLHTDDFIEFTVLPYLISIFAVLFIVSAFAGSKKLINILLIAFILFGVVAMVDFWKWEYDYGHNLDPNAAIKVPGMAYQPPLIGFKQLLNFGAFSIPAIGGSLFIGSGLLVLSAAAIELKQKIKPGRLAVLIPLIALLSSCGSNGPKPINFNKDACSYCKMSISEPSFAVQLTTKKGRTYSFDDLKCMLNYLKSEDQSNVNGFYVANSEADYGLVDAKTAWFIKSEEIKSPMGGNTLAFQTKKQAEDYAQQYQASLLSWDDLIKKE